MSGDIDWLLGVIAERGLSVALDSSGEPRLDGPGEQITGPLREAMRLWRDELAERLRPPPAREWLWRTGHRHAGDGSERPDWHPVGASWWRWRGEGGWRLVEARLADARWIDPDALRRGGGLPQGERMAGDE